MTCWRPRETCRRLFRKPEKIYHFSFCYIKLTNNPCRLSPNDKNIKNELRRLKSLLGNYKQKQKSVSAKMMEEISREEEGNESWSTSSSDEGHRSNDEGNSSNDRENDEIIEGQKKVKRRSKGERLKRRKTHRAPRTTTSTVSLDELLKSTDSTMFLPESQGVNEMTEEGTST